MREGFLIVFCVPAWHNSYIKYILTGQKWVTVKCATIETWVGNHKQYIRKVKMTVFIDP